MFYIILLLLRIRYPSKIIESNACLRLAEFLSTELAISLITIEGYSILAFPSIKENTIALKT